MGARVPRPPPYSTVAFDCDSTLATIEGIEELAGASKEEIRRITDAAMNGSIAIERVYGARLAAVQPTRSDVEALGARYVRHLLPNVAALVSALRFLDKRVCIVSGGLEAPVLELARAIGVEARDVFAVRVRHDAEGRYAGFDEGSPLTRSGGKLAVAEELARADAGLGLVFVGDGVTDLEAKPACARFVAFGGVVRRPVVFEAADVGCAEADHAALLPLLCEAAEIERLASDDRHRSLVRRSRELHP